jgi:hypothetical protein
MNGHPPSDPRNTETPEEVEERVRVAKQQRVELTAASRDLVATVTRLLFGDDPLGINAASNTDEYTAEAEVIVIGLPRAANVGEVVDLAHQTFVQWFSAEDAGPREHYERVAGDIWQAWLQPQGREAWWGFASARPASLANQHAHPRPTGWWRSHPRLSLPLSAGGPEPRGGTVGRRGHDCPVATDFERDIHALLASVRAVSAAHNDPASNFALNMQLAYDAYARGPLHAVFVAAQIAALRLFQIDRAREAQGLELMPFPEDELMASNAGRTPAGQDCIRFLGNWAGSAPTREPIDALIAKHGLPGFMMLVQVANEVGRMLAEIDPDFEDLSDLLQKEALADELSWDTWPT